MRGMAEKNPRGRPPKNLATDIQEHICRELSEGRSLRAICREDEAVTYSEGSVRYYLIKDASFFALYARARDIGLDVMMGEILDICDDGSNDFYEKERKDGSKYEAPDHENINRSRLRVDTRKWTLSKLAPKRYGDKIQTEITNPDGSLQPLTTTDAVAKLNSILASARIAKAEAQTEQTDTKTPPEDTDSGNMWD